MSPGFDQPFKFGFVHQLSLFGLCLCFQRLFEIACLMWCLSHLASRFPPRLKRTQTRRLDLFH